MTDQVQAPVPVADPAVPPVDSVAPAIPDPAVVTEPAPVADPADVPPPMDPALLPPTEDAKPTKSPLEILDSILNDAEAKTAEDNAKKEEEEKKKREEEVAQKKAEDERQIAAELAALDQVKYSPQEQAKVDQKNELDQKEEEYKEEMDGMGIAQLGHTKI